MNAFFNPRAWGGVELPDLFAWAGNFILIEGKMRGLFSMLFGASMLLVIEGADAKGEVGSSVHFRRMIWLAVFGLIHGYLIWHGDILFTYAVIGMAATFLVAKEPKLIHWAIGLFLAQFLLMGMAIGGSWAVSLDGQWSGADAELVKSFQNMLHTYGLPWWNSLPRSPRREGAMATFWPIGRSGRSRCYRLTM